MGNKILVVESLGYGKAVEGLGDITGNTGSFFQKPEDFKLVMFTGGSDVSPKYYDDDDPHGTCFCNPKRDEKEAAIWLHAFKNKIKMTGICRGAQLINVMSGGRMMHDISNHTGSHAFESFVDDEVIAVTSTHHQMIVPPEDGFVIGWSKERLSHYYVGRNDELENWDEPETEAIFIPRTRCAAVQYHPEYMKVESQGYLWYWNMVSSFLNNSLEEFQEQYTGDNDAGKEVLHKSLDASA